MDLDLDGLEEWIDEWIDEAIIPQNPKRLHEGFIDFDNMDLKQRFSEYIYYQAAALCTSLSGIECVGGLMLNSNGLPVIKCEHGKTEHASRYMTVEYFKHRIHGRGNSIFKTKEQSSEFHYILHEFELEIVYDFVVNIALKYWTNLVTRSKSSEKLTWNQKKNSLLVPTPKPRTQNILWKFSDNYVSDKSKWEFCDSREFLYNIIPWVKSNPLNAPCERILKRFDTLCKNVNFVPDKFYEALGVDICDVRPRNVLYDVCQACSGSTSLVLRKNCACATFVSAASSFCLRHLSNYDIDTICRVSIEEEIFHEDYLKLQERIIGQRMTVEQLADSLGFPHCITRDVISKLVGQRRGRPKTMFESSITLPAAKILLISAHQTTSAAFIIACLDAEIPRKRMKLYDRYGMSTSLLNFVDEWASDTAPFSTVEAAPNSGHTAPDAAPRSAVEAAEHI